eukprot:m.164315 g.164315  ORF g.164315 m.164315 type:complete len:69 (-) comp15232_c1_seq3:687-893(-)
MCVGPCSWLDGPGHNQSIMDPDTAQVTPAELCQKLLQAAKEMGARVVQQEATGLRHKDGEYSCYILEA